jgi:protein O-mannosyl-transferase
LDSLFCLLSKEAGILFLPIIIFLFWTTKKPKIKELLITSTPLLAITLGWLVLHQYIINSSSFTRIQYTYLDNSLLSCENKITQFATGISILGRYILKTIVPTNLSYDYSFHQIPCVELGSFACVGSLLLIGLLFFIAYFFRKKNPVISFGIAFFFITIFLVSNVFTLIGATMGDRLLYTPVLGITIAFVFAIFYSLKAMQNTAFYHLTSAVFVGIALVFSLASFNRNKAWKSNFTLFTTDVTNAPNSARVHYNNATAYFTTLPENVSEQQSLLPDIITSYKKALSIDPNDKGSLMNLGVCYYRIKEYEKSIDCTKKAIAISQNDYSLYGNLADAYFMSNNFDKAILNYEFSIKNNSVQYNTYNYLGVAWFNKKNYPKAIEVFKKGLQLQPEHAEMYLNYGNALAISSRIKEAIPMFEKAYALNPNQKNALQFLAMCYAQIGNNEKATAYLNQFKNAK